MRNILYQPHPDHSIAEQPYRQVPSQQVQTDLQEKKATKAATQLQLQAPRARVSVTLSPPRNTTNRLPAARPI